MSANTFTTEFAESALSDLLNDPGSAGVLNSESSGRVPIVTAGAEARTLNAPERPGLWLQLDMVTDGGNCTVAFGASASVEGHVTLTFDAVGDTCILLAVNHGGTPKWGVLYNNGVATA